MTNDELIDMYWSAPVLNLTGAQVAGLRNLAAAAWAEGFEAADINTPRSRKGHWEDDRPRKGLRTWIPDPLPSNPYAVVSPEGPT